MTVPSLSNNLFSGNTNLLLFAISVIFITVYIVLFSGEYVYDEPYHVSNLVLAEEKGLGVEFLENMNGLAGPLYTYLHYLIKPFSEMEVVKTRLVNTFLAILIGLFTYQNIRLLNPDNKDIAFVFFCIPMSFPTSGMTLTEIPAMFFFSISLLGCTYFFTKKSKHLISFQSFLLFLSGLSFSLAIAGRQPYAACLAAFGITFIYYKSQKRIILSTILFLTLSLLLPLYLFYIWGSLVPASDRAVATSQFFTPTNLMMALGYSFFIMSIIAYPFLKNLKRTNYTYTSLMALISVSTAFYYNIKFIPLTSTTLKVLPKSVLFIYGHVMAGIIIFLGIWFLISLLERMYENRRDFLFILFSLMLLAIIFSCIRIAHQFSSRYVFQAAPLFLLLASYYYRRNFYQAFLHVVGIVIGILSLMSYY